MTVKVDGVKQVSQKNVFVNGDVQRQGHWSLVDSYEGLEDMHMK